MENKYKEGDVVLERIHPNQKLIVTKFFRNMYYCTIQEYPDRKELVYNERDLISEADLAVRR
jgi:hypothetical protein